MTIDLQRSRNTSPRAARRRSASRSMLPKGKMDNGHRRRPGRDDRATATPRSSGSAARPRSTPVFQTVSFPRAITRSRSTSTGSRSASPEARRLRGRVRPGHRAGLAVRQQGPPDRQGAGIHDKPHTIQMNEPLDASGLHVLPVELPPRARPQDRQRRTGRFQSVFQVATNPGRNIKYAGMPARGAGGLRAVLHASRPLHRRRQARACPRRGQGPQESTAPANGDGVPPGGGVTDAAEGEDVL